MRAAEGATEDEVSLDLGLFRQGAQQRFGQTPLLGAGQFASPICLYNPLCRICREVAKPHTESVRNDLSGGPEDALRGQREGDAQAAGSVAWSGTALA
jgi:hypothetical protein